MRTPINTAKALEKALCDGKDNTSMTVALFEGTAEFNYGARNYKGWLPPHVAIWVNAKDGEHLSYPAAHYVLKTEDEEVIILIYNL